MSSLKHSFISTQSEARGTGKEIILPSFSNNKKKKLEHLIEIIIFTFQFSKIENIRPIYPFEVYLYHLYIHAVTEVYGFQIF